MFQLQARRGMARGPQSSIRQLVFQGRVSMIRRCTALQTAVVVMMMAAAPAAQAPIETTVVLVRHAEVLPDGSADPVLAESGIARATALAEVLKDAGVKAILTTHYKRTIMTGEPLSASAKVPLMPLGIKAGTAGLDAHVREVVHSV